MASIASLTRLFPSKYSSLVDKLDKDSIYDATKDSDGNIALQYLEDPKKTLIILADLKLIAKARDTSAMLDTIENVNHQMQIALLISAVYTIYRLSSLSSDTTESYNFNKIDKMVLTTTLISIFYLFSRSFFKEKSDQIRTTSALIIDEACARTKERYDKAAEFLLRNHLKKPLIGESTSTASQSAAEKKASDLNISSSPIEKINIKMLSNQLTYLIGSEKKSNEILKTLVDVTAYIKDPFSMPSNLRLLGMIKAGTIGEHLVAGTQTVVNALGVLGTVATVVRSWKNSGILTTLSALYSETVGADTAPPVTEKEKVS